ncbi:MAG: hypothetical protein ABFD20_01855 [Anaerolineales bacterium]
MLDPMCTYSRPADWLKACLADLEERLDLVEESGLLHAWQAFSAGQFTGELFSPRRSALNPARVQWPMHVPVNAALADPDLMALQQYLACSRSLEMADGLLLNVRANYGTGILPSLFGARPLIMADELDTLPTTWPLGDVAAIERLVDAGVPDLSQGMMPQVLAMGARYAEIAAQYPQIGAQVFIYHPDLQGPFDVVELLWGSSVFLALFDRPALVHALLELVTQTYVRALEAWQQIVPFHPEGNAHWGYYHRGNIMLRDDSAMNLSPAMFAEFVRPYDQRLFDHFGGGALHFCGRGDHYLPQVAEMRGVYAVAMSQPEYNDMERVFTYTVDQGINLLGLDCAAARAALAVGRPLHGRVHVAP